MRKIALMSSVAAVVALVSTGAAADDLMKAAKDVFEPISAKKVVLKDNEMTKARRDLGAALFFEPRLSSSHLISCATCHNVAIGGVDGLETSVGHGWQKGPRNAPTVLNAVFNIAQFWDGRAENMAEQAKGPVQAGVEMNNTPEAVIETLVSIPEYIEMFKVAFPKEKNPVTFDNMAKAIEVFEAELITPNSKFDKFLAGDAKALNAQEREGLKLFMDKGCTTCHSGINIGGQGYFPFGLVEAPDGNIRPDGDKGRMAVTSTGDDAFVFRAAPLRNIALTAPYFHSGKVWDLKEAVKVMGTAQLGADLSAKEVDDITAFLNTLTGEQPKVVIPTLPVSTNKTPKPVL